MRVSFLVMSDIHFGKFSACPDFSAGHIPPNHYIESSKPMKNDLIEKIKGKEEINAIFVTGDLTSVGSPTEFTECLHEIYNIANEINVPKENIFICFGNHDVDWKISALAKNNERDQLYRNIASSIGQLCCPVLRGFEEGPLPGTGIYEGEFFNLYVLNSGYYCIDDQAYQHGKLGLKQLDWLKEKLPKSIESDKWQILIVHHHLRNYPYPNPIEDISCIEEGAELVELVGSRAIDLVCHGHRHHPKIFSIMQNDWLYPVTFFCAGSLAVNHEYRHNGQISNAFHILTLERRLENNAAFGTLKSYQYNTHNGWMPSKYSEMFPLDHIQRFGAIATEKEKIKKAQSIVEEIITTPNNNKLLLPSMNELPDILQCTTLDELNKIFIKSAQNLPVQLIGQYPEAVAVFENR